MLGAIFTSLSGMHAYQTGLDTISNNVANMNTPGFKLSNPLFRDLVNKFSGAVGEGTQNQAKGGGVTANQSVMSFQQGNFQDTGNSLNAAIDGGGFFVLDQDGKTSYTRAGQFELNKDGVLVESGTGAKVMVSTDASASGPFDVNAVRVFPPKATTMVNLSGSLARAGTTTTYDLSQISVIDTSGAKQTLSAHLVRDSADPLHWTVNVMDSTNAVIGTGDIRFNADGTPASGSSTITATVKPTDTPAFDLTFDFGAPGTYAGVSDTSGTTTSQLQVLKQDGLAIGSVTQFAFDGHGRLSLTYSNGEKKTVATLVLARFETPDQIKEIGQAHFVTVGAQQPVLGSALDNGFGSIAGGKIEMSNVDLTNQFTDLIIVQRGFQGSSQITSVANEMMQQLLAMNGNK